MELWMGCLIVACGCFVMGIVSIIRKSGSAASDNSGVKVSPPGWLGRQQEVTMPPNSALPPREWDEASIAQQLTQLRNEKPNLIPHFVESLKERFIVRQDDRTAEVRIRFLKKQIEQLRLAKEFQQTIDDLAMLGLERTKRVKQLELDTEEIDVKKRMLTQKEELEARLHRRKMELEIAQLEKELDGLRHPKEEPRLSPQELRNRERAAVEANLARLKEEKQKALQIDDAAERILRVNAIDDAIQREMERWAKLL